MSPLVQFLILTASSLLAALVSVPKQLEALASLGRRVPIPRGAAVIQDAVLSVLAAGIGLAVAGKTGFQSLQLLNGGNPVRGISNVGLALFSVTAITVVAFLGHILIYYVVFRPRLPPNEVIFGERMRLEMGLFARLLHGGIVEEVQFRWGLMSLLAWVGLVLLPLSDELVLWVAIVVSAVGFAFFHLLGARGLGMGSDGYSIGLILVDNTWVGIFFGWLFWENGLVAAVISHTLLHLFWFPIEKIMLERFETRRRSA